MHTRAQPRDHLDAFQTIADDARNTVRWGLEPQLDAWFYGARLDWLKRLGPPLPTEPAAHADALSQLRAAPTATADLGSSYLHIT